MLGGILTEYYNFRIAFYLAAAIVAILGVSCNLLLIRSPEQMEEKPLGWSEKETEPVNTQIVSNHQISANETMRSTPFWMLFIGVLLGSFAVNGLHNYSVAYFREEGFSVIQASNISAIRSLFAVMVMVLGGYIVERYGTKVYTGMLYTSFIICIIILLSVKPLLFISAVIAMFFAAMSQPITTSMVPTIITSIFGNRDYKKNCNVSYNTKLY